MSKGPEISETLGSGLKRAFTWHWHVLGLGAGVAAAVLSGGFLAWLPFLCAAEIGYLGLLGLNPRFQNVLKGKSRLPESLHENSTQRFAQLMEFLSPVNAQRFETLRSRCMDLVNLRRTMTVKEGVSGADDFRGESLDRMLWLYLKLLHQCSGLERFLGATDRDEIAAELKTAEAQLATAQSRDESSGMPEGRLTTSIRDRVATIRERLENHRKATEGLELVTAEIEKTEQQITHLCEVGMTMSDSAGLSVQIDTISQSLQSSEKIFSETSFSQIYDDEPAPPILSGSKGRTAISQ